MQRTRIFAAKTSQAAALATVCLAMFSSPAFAAAPGILPVQGHITDAGGVAVEGAHDLAFVVYDGETMGNVIYQESLTAVPVTHGDFAVYLGQAAWKAAGDAGIADGGAGLDLAKFRDNGTLYVELTIDATDVVAPRFALGSVPYAGFSQYCAQANGVSDAALSSLPSGVGIGAAASAGSALTLGGNVTFAPTANATIGFTPTNTPGHNLTIQAGGSVTSWGSAAVGGDLILKAGNANVSGSADPCLGGPDQNSVKIYAGDNLFNAICSTTRNGNVEFYAGNNQPLRMLIVGDSGNVGIGTNTPSSLLHVNGTITTPNAVVVTSDARYKTNVATLADALDKIEHMRGVAFDWRYGDYPDIQFEAGRQLGFIAQELQEVLPEAVSEDAKGMYSVAYTKVIPVLVEGIKEQESTLEAVKDENRRLDRALEETKQKQILLERRLTALESKLLNGSGRP